MPTKQRPYSRLTRHALALLGQQIRMARKERRMTEQELAERVGISRSTIRNIEQGSPSVAIGLVFEAAVLLGVPLFAEDEATLSAQRARLEDKLALLPQAVRARAPQVKDDF